MRRPLITFAVIFTFFVGANYPVRVVAEYHYGARAVDWVQPGEAIRDLARWSLEIQPWWMFAAMFDPWATPTNEPIRRWFHTESFQILGSAVSAVLYSGAIALLSAGRIYIIRNFRRGSP